MIRQRLEESNLESRLAENFYLSDIVAFELENQLSWPVVTSYFQYSLSRHISKSSGLTMKFDISNLDPEYSTVVLTPGWQFWIYYKV